jgi:hypothetical protein
MNEFERRLLDAVQNSAWIASVARPGRTILDIDYYNYNTSILGLVTATTSTAVIQIQSDSDFAIAYMSGAAIVAGAVQNDPVALIQYTDTGTGKTFFQNPTLFSLVEGNNGLPFYLPAPRVLAPNTNINVTITNNIGSTADFFVNLLGARIYYAS